MNNDWLTLVSIVLSEPLISAIGVSVAFVVLTIAIAYLVQMVRNQDDER